MTTPSARAWLVLGIVTTILVTNRFQFALLGWFAAVPWLVYLRSTSGWKSRLLFLGVLQVALFLQLLKIVTEPLPWFFAAMFSVPTALFSGGLFVGFEAWRRRVGDAWGIAVFVALTVASEWLAWTTSDMGSWGASAYTQLDNLPLLQTASLFGLAGIAVLTSATSALTAVVLTSDQPRRWLPAGAGLATLIALAHGYGVARLQAHPEGPMVTVAAVVSDIGLGAEGAPSAAVIAEANDQLFARTEQAVAAGAELIVWNEGATLIEASDEGAFVERGQALATSAGVDLVLAYVVPLDGMTRFENKYVWLGPDGEVETYFKHHPVPSEGSVKGTDPIEVHERPWGVAGGAICYDYDFPALAREHARLGAGLVFVPASDWAGIDPTHTWMARVRGIEGGFSVVRPVRWATSAAFDAFGRPLASMPWQDSDHLMIARVPVEPRPTLYARIGDVLPWGSLGVLLLGGLVLVRTFYDRGDH